MKKLILLALILLPNISLANVSYIDEAKQLGTVAGQGKACNASKTRTFEMLSHAIILTKGSTVSARDSALKAYLKEKVRAFMFTKSECPEVLATFDNQEIFNIKLYKDGTIQMPDGKVFKPKIPYDATNI
ncbi:MAG: hypothetical protein R3Y43_04535 [Alphaproteobacteria bacterium]